MRNTLISLVLLAVPFASSAVAQTSKPAVGNYPPIQEYLMPQASESGLQKSASPPRRAFLRITGNPEVSLNRLEMSVLPTNRQQL
jgi:hypothetical protein